MEIAQLYLTETPPKLALDEDGKSHFGVVDSVQAGGWVMCWVSGWLPFYARPRTFFVVVFKLFLCSCLLIWCFMQPGRVYILSPWVHFYLCVGCKKWPLCSLCLMRLEVSLLIFWEGCGCPSLQKTKSLCTSKPVALWCYNTVGRFSWMRLSGSLNCEPLGICSP